MKQDKFVQLLKKELHQDIREYVDIILKNWNIDEDLGNIIILDDFEDFHTFDKEFSYSLRSFLKNPELKYKDFKYSDNEYKRIVSILSKRTGKRGLEDFNSEKSELVLKFIELRVKYSK